MKRAILPEEAVQWQQKYPKRSVVKLWGEVQLIVLISRTRKEKDNISAGDKRGTLEALKALLQKRHIGLITKKKFYLLLQ